MVNEAAAAGILPGEPLPVRLMNTIWADRRGVRHDSIATVPDLAAWLEAIDMAEPSTPVTTGDLAQARQLRDALRVLAQMATADRQETGAQLATADRQETDRAGATGADVSGAVAAVNAGAAAGYSPPRIGSRDGRLIADVVVAPAGLPVAAALSVVAIQAIGLLTDADSPLRACHGPGCVLFFVRDHPRREWCSAGCGNRARAARHYRRHRRTARNSVTSPALTGPAPLSQLPEVAAGEHVQERHQRDQGEDRPGQLRASRGVPAREQVDPDQDYRKRVE